MDQDIIDAASKKKVPSEIILGACISILIGTMAYGFVFGVWRAPLQGIYSAIKMPILFFSALLSSAVINTMLAQLMGSGLSFRQVCVVILFGMAIGAIIMGALSPIVLFVIYHLPAADPSVVGLPFSANAVAGSRQVYWSLLLLHVAIIGFSGIIGNIRLYSLLKTLISTKQKAIRILAVWILIIGFVGCELSWVLSPFLCKPTRLPHIIAREYSQENFYERVWRGMTSLKGV